MATQTQVKAFINQVGPLFSKYGKQHNFNIVSFAIAQACLESGYGTSEDAKNLNNILGIGPHMSFSSIEKCVEGYYTLTELGKSVAAKTATTLDQYYNAFVQSGYLGGSGQLEYYNSIKSIINSNDLTKYDKGGSAYGQGASNSGKLEEFIAECLSHKGENFYKFVGPTLGKKTREAWCADFVWACAKKVGIEGTLISGSASAHLLISQTIDKCGAVEHKGSSEYTPQKGDIVNFVWNGGTWADHVGVVTGCENGTVYTVEGNSSDSVKLRSYSRSSSVFLRFCTPNWGESVGSGSGSQLPDNLFEYENVDEDAILREIAYAQKEKKSGKNLYVPKLNSDRIKLSIINYTALQSAFYKAGQDMGVFGVVSGAQYDLAQLDSNVREILEHLQTKGISYSGGCGICANIFYESGFKTSNSSKGYMFGLLNFDATMKLWVGLDWSTDVTGQIDYLIYKLESNHKVIFDDLKAMPEIKTSASQAASYIYSSYLEKEDDEELEKRKKKAEEYFSKITRVQTITSNGGTNDTFVSIQATGKRKEAIDRAKSQLGKPYAWGACGPDSYDCSGLVGYALTGKYERIGTTDTFNAWPTSQTLEPGDVVVSSGHTGLFIGDGKMIHAPTFGDVVKIGPVQSDMKYVVPVGYY